MVGTEGPRPSGRALVFEQRWSGARVLVVNTPGLTVVTDAGGRDVSAAFPEVRRLSRALGSTEVILDGVVTGEPASLARRLELPGDSVIRRLARDHPVALKAFDLLWRDGHPRVDRPWHERRDELESLDLDGPAWQVPPLLDRRRVRPDAAIVVKRRESRYRPGEVSDQWVVVRAGDGRP
jgi:bifunctional non-homologous end joining protein LigD